MTQDTNNQEWWVEEWRDQFAESGVDYGEDADELAEEWNQKQIAFIRKVSQQSREDALKECVEMAERNKYIFGERLVLTADNLLDWLKSKLPKQ